MGTEKLLKPVFNTCFFSSPGPIYKSK